MPKKILISCLTLEEGNIIPLLLKSKEWQSLGYRVTFFGNKKLKDRIKNSSLIRGYKFIELKKTRSPKNKIDFIYESLRRNFLARCYIGRLKNRYDVVYSISSVLDMVIFPYFLKRKDKKIKWGVVFDNTVPLFRGVNFPMRLLAWIFFKFSLIILKKADKIFAISNELKQFLLKSNFEKNRIILTGNAIEVDLISKATYDDIFDIDILYVGRINSAKGIYDMLKVLNIVKKNRPDIQLAIMGAGDKKEEQKFKDRISEMKLGGNVKFLGFRSGIEKFNIIKSSKCFLFLSNDESFGVALLEAVCCGLHAFAYNLPVFDKIYQNNEIDITKKGDFKTVAEKITTFLNKNNLKNKAGELLLNNYTWDKIARKEINSL